MRRGRQPVHAGMSAAGPAPDFIRDVAEADFEREVLARSEQVPVVVDFWAPWCGPCRAMAPVFERAARELEPQARLVKVNTDAAQALAERLDIRGIPTFAIFERGREVARVAGAMNLARFVEWVRASV
ncbi:MAG: thioredoxin [Bacteroidota bacterium]